jgi:hypothetical protein
VAVSRYHAGRFFSFEKYEKYERRLLGCSRARNIRTDRNTRRQSGAQSRRLFRFGKPASGDARVPLTTPAPWTLPRPSTQARSMRECFSSHNGSLMALRTPIPRRHRHQQIFPRHQTRSSLQNSSTTLLTVPVLPLPVLTLPPRSKPHHFPSPPSGDTARLSRQKVRIVLVSRFAYLLRMLISRLSSDRARL